MFPVPFLGWFINAGLAISGIYVIAMGTKKDCAIARISILYGLSSA